MFVPAPIDDRYVPYTQRSLLKRNVGLLVDSGRVRGSGATSVAQLQATGMFCADKDDCVRCGYQRVCVNGSCVSIYSNEGAAACSR
jgi:hypothetical protein